MFDTNQAVQPQKIPKGLKFRIQEVERLHYLWSENKEADQQSCYSTSIDHYAFVFTYAKIRVSHETAHI